MAGYDGLISSVGPANKRTIKMIKSIIDLYDSWHAALPTLPQIIAGRRDGRADDDQVTCFLNTLGMGYQFAAAGYLVHEKATEAGIGNELPTDWFTETVHP